MNSLSWDLLLQITVAAIVWNDKCRAGNRLKFNIMLTDTIAVLGVVVAAENMVAGRETMSASTLVDYSSL